MQDWWKQQSEDFDVRNSKSLGCNCLLMLSIEVSFKMILQWKSRPFTKQETSGKVKKY